VRAEAPPARGAGRADAEDGVTLSESDGVRYLHFGTEWVQGAMRLARPYALELEYQQQMMAPLLFAPEPARVLQLGLGAAALTKACHRYLRQCRTVVVELSPRVIEVARRSFALPPDDARLQVVQGDAARYLRAAAGAGADWLQVDLYDARARGPVLDSAAFYRDCRRALAAEGIAAFNLFGGALAPSLGRIEQAFGPAWLRLPRSAAGNVVVLAFTGGLPPWDPARRHARARALERRFGWPARAWIDGLRVAGRRRPSGPSMHA
jgi:spermidine synthase